MKIVIKMPACYGDKVEIDGVVLSGRDGCEALCTAIMSAADIVWPIEPSKDITKEKNGAGNNKK